MQSCAVRTVKHNTMKDPLLDLVPSAVVRRMESWASAFLPHLWARRIRHVRLEHGVDRISLYVGLRLEDVDAEVRREKS